MDVSPRGGRPWPPADGAGGPLPGAGHREWPQSCPSLPPGLGTLVDKSYFLVKAGGDLGSASCWWERRDPFASASSSRDARLGNLLRFTLKEFQANRGVATVAVVLLLFTKKVLLDPVFWLCASTSAVQLAVERSFKGLLPKS
jgi:hypothetical protein